MQQEQQTALVTPEEIIHLLLEEMEAGLCPSFYSNLVPSVYDIYLYTEDLERLRPLEQRIRDEACRALGEKLSKLNRAGEPMLKLPIALPRKARKKYEALGEWAIEFHENTDDDAKENPLVIHSTFPVAVGGDDRVGTLTERVTKRRADGQTTSSISTQRSGNLDTKRASGFAYANIDYEDDTGAHTYQMAKDLIKIGRGAADRWVDLKLNAKKDVSREHVQIRRDPESGRFFIKDLSTLGSTVDGKRIPASIERIDGEERDNNVEAPLPDRARIGLAGVLFLEFRAIKQK
jgi:hypothetical protein